MSYSDTQFSEVTVTVSQFAVDHSLPYITPLCRFIPIETSLCRSLRQAALATPLRRVLSSSVRAPKSQGEVAKA